LEGKYFRIISAKNGTGSVENRTESTENRTGNAENGTKENLNFLLKI